MQIGVLGAGAFGTALGQMLAQNGYRVTLWSNEPDVLLHMQTHREHPTRLGNIKLHFNLSTSLELEHVVRQSDVLISAVPMVAIRSVWEEAKRFLATDTLIVSASKGVMPGLLFAQDVFADVLGNLATKRLAFLSGPSFANEVAALLPTCAVLAASELQVAKAAESILSSPTFRTQLSKDVVGVEIGGAFKNVMAIGAGILEGLQLGNNALAFWLVAGVQELAFVIQSLGGEYDTAFGPSCMGDLVLTCTGQQSRNRFVGQQLAQGKTIDAVLKNMAEYAEGVHTAKMVPALEERVFGKLPLMRMVHDVLFCGLDPKSGITKALQEIF